MSDEKQNDGTAADNMDSSEQNPEHEGGSKKESESNLQPAWEQDKAAQSRKWKLFFLIFIVGIILDQATKYWIWFNIRYPRPYFRNSCTLDEVLAQDGSELTCDALPIIPNFFELVHTHNAGAAFGIMQGKMIIFAVFTIVAMVWIFVTIRAMHPDDKLQNVSLSLIASGAIGNGIDRMVHQEVIDFLRVYTVSGCTEENGGLWIDKRNPYLEDPNDMFRVAAEKCDGLTGWLHSSFNMTEWPSFNVADAAIVVGLGLYIIHGIFFDKDEDPEEDTIPEPKITDGGQV